MTSGMEKKPRDMNQAAIVIPKGVHVDLSTKQLKPNPNNPRRLFDPSPLEDLKQSIREHGILVPLTVYKLPGQDKYAILDGERRYRCCLELEKKGLKVRIPANVVEAPDKAASLIYMFNIHAFREEWELMPTALGLKQLIEHLHTFTVADMQHHLEEINQLTGLSFPQIERCRKILTFPEKFQRLSLEADPAKRIPSNFWIELYPVLKLVKEYTPDLYQDLGRDEITQRMVDKYRDKKIKSVVHLRRVSESFDLAQDQDDIQLVSDRLREFVLEPELETREGFDGLIKDKRRFKTVLEAADRFLKDVTKAKVDHTLEGKNELIAKLNELLDFLQKLLDSLSGEDPPPVERDETESE